MRAWRKYWLMVVSSLNSTLFRCCTTLASPFIAASGEPAMVGRSGRRGQRLGRLNVTQQVARAVAAAPATRADTELEGKLVQRAGTVSRAVAHGFLGDGVADADIQSSSGLLDKNNYHLKRTNLASS